MISADAFRDLPTLTGRLVRLEPLTGDHFDAYWPMFSDVEGMRLTGSHREFSEADIRGYLSSRQTQLDRADWAIVRKSDDTLIGEVVLNDLDGPNESLGFRIATVAPRVRGLGYGTEATRLAVDYAFDVVGIHRIALEVYDFNPRATRVYEKCGFVREGTLRQALLWEGEWHDAIVMSILSSDPRG